MLISVYGARREFRLVLKAMKNCVCVVFYEFAPSTSLTSLVGKKTGSLVCARFSFFERERERRSFKRAMIENGKANISLAIAISFCRFNDDFSKDLDDSRQCQSTLDKKKTTFSSKCRPLTIKVMINLIVKVCL